MLRSNGGSVCFGQGEATAVWCASGGGEASSGGMYLGGGCRCRRVCGWGCEPAVEHGQDEENRGRGDAGSGDGLR